MNRLDILFMLSWRNLWRNHRRTAIMLGAISIGVWAMLFMTALSRGMVNDMIDSGLRMLPGHVQAHHPDFVDDPSINNILSLNDVEISRLLGDAGVSNWASRIKVPAVVMSERASRGVILHGIDPLMEDKISFFSDQLSDGRFLESVSDKGIVIGVSLAEKLETKIGRRIVVMSQDPKNEIADRGFRIVGLFEADLSQTEETLVFAGKNVVGQMLGIEGRVSEVFSVDDNYRDTESLLEKISNALGDDVDVKAWHELNSYLGSMLEVMDGFVLVWMVVIFLALSFGLVNTLAMAIFERVREIGLLLALGMRPGNIVTMILIESLLLLVLGLVIGNILAWSSIFALADGIDFSSLSEGMEMIGASSLIRPELTRFDVVMANLVVLLLGLLASLSPAFRAARYKPIEAITKV